MIEEWQSRKVSDIDPGAMISELRREAETYKAAAEALKVELKKERDVAVFNHIRAEVTEELLFRIMKLKKE